MRVFTFRSKLAAIAALGLGLRLLGTAWGEPYEYHFDEPFLLKPALRIVESGDLNPHFFRYPSLMIYLESMVVAANNSLGGMPLAVPNDPSYGPQDLYPETWPALFGGRHLVAAFGALGIIAVGLAARALGGDSAGLFAALGLALFPLHVEHSHYLTTDVPACTFLTLAVAALLSGSGWGATVLAGGAAGLAISTKYTAGAVLLVLAGLLALREKARPRTLAAHALLLLVGAVAGFVATSPFALFDYSSFMGDLGIVKTHYTTGHLGAEGSTNWSWYAMRLYQDGTGGVGLALLAAGCALAAWDSLRHRGRGQQVGSQVGGHLTGLVIVSAALVWFLWLGTVRVRFERNLLPAMVLACTAAGYGWAALFDFLRSRNATAARVSACLLLAALTAPAFITGRIITDLRAEDTRSVAANWIAQHVPHGASIVREEYTPQPDGGKYRVRYSWSLAVQDATDYQQSGVEYLIASQAIYGRILNDTEPQVRAMADRYRRMFLFPRVASFAPGKGVRGPLIEIFEVPVSPDEGDD